MTTAIDCAALAERLSREGKPFVMATVVRAHGSTAARPGDRGVVGADGALGAGWIGGGCVRGAVLRAARAALGEGRPRLVAILPEAALAARQVAAGEERDGIHYARNACVGEGSVDVFIEPVLPAPRLRVFGDSPVAACLTRLATEFGFALPREATAVAEESAPGFVVVATQGRGDLDALKAALMLDAPYTAFVGSPRKVEALRQAILAAGEAPPALARLRGPAGLEIGAETPEEIALSIIAEMVRERRRPAAAAGEANG